jgi:hypothetical protein
VERIILRQRFLKGIKNMFRKNKQAGYLSLIAVAIIVVFSLFAVTAHYLISTSSEVQRNIQTSTQGLYIAETGLDLTTSGLTGPFSVGNGESVVNLDLGCIILTANGYVGNSTTYNALRSIAVNYMPYNVVWSLTSVKGVLLLDPSVNTWNEINDVVSSGNAITFGSYDNGWIVGSSGSAWHLADLTSLGCNGDNLAWDSVDLKTVLNNKKPNLNALSLPSDDELWVVGDNLQKKEFTVLKVATQTNSWCLLETRTSAPASGCTSLYVNTNSDADELFGVKVLDTNGDGVGDLGFAVGGSNSGGVILQFDGTKWDLTSVATAALKAVFVSSDGSYSEAWAVGRDSTGSNGVILKWTSTAGSWSIVYTGSSTFNAIDMLDLDGDGIADYGWAVGDSTTIMEYTGGSWVNQSGVLGGSAQLSSVKLFATDDIWFGGNGGSSWHYDGASWTQVNQTGVGNFNAFGKINFPAEDYLNSWQEIIN